MARYDYRCAACGTTFEVEHRMSAHPNISCPACGGTADKQFSAAGIVFEGSGFYNTDQRRADAPKPAARECAQTPACSASKSKSSGEGAHPTECATCPNHEKVPARSAKKA
ncbi:regulatory protein, FmdB family [Coriobacterium glomerans PW2]|uniref:Regulatory protein, FmdB family n=1 Tax=Coriobacterium glomerans (strain ATCC 49209 / DSM 20642 / JCM 10262 / PW2) TaxID=700015 RepID=F2N9T0_CORGP|nr:FmdB family zinc ribbon protein [Coriobacterium glomerans]AEB07183.1 regulatory protein, FmdB family [Coriobacterium glomerans PW2]